MSRILLATDGSPSSERGTRVAVGLAQATAWPLTIVTVRHLPPTGLAYEPLSVVDELEAAAREQAEAALESAAAIARASGIEPELRLLEGVPADEICAAAEQRAATLVVVGAHGWGTVRRLLFGSISEAVLRRAPCPVLVVRGEQARG
jgi:nucleotide-binding universal stress UspA family protein